MVGVKSLAHNAYYVKDMAAMLAFYCGVLGLKKAFELPDGSGKPWLVYVEVGPGQFIEFFHGGQGRAAAPPRAAGFEHMCFAVDDVEAAAQALRDAGWPLDSEPVVGKCGCPLFFVNDPEGNRIELMQIAPDSLQGKYAAGRI